MRRDVLVYLSGAMTARGGALVEENVAAGFRAFLDCLTAGIPAFCPQIIGAFPSAWTALDQDTWLAYDACVIDRCTHVLMLPGWQHSTGAQWEKAYAEAHGIPVIHTLTELLNAD